MTNEFVTDPVCGMTKPKDEMKFSILYKGGTYYFCSQQDKDIFEKYPERWVGGEKE